MNLTRRHVETTISKCAIQDRAYPPSTTTGRLLSRGVTGLRSHLRGSQERSMHGTATGFRRMPLLRGWVNRGKERARLGFVPAWLTRFLELLSVVLYSLGRLGPVANLQQLVGGAQVLLDRGLRQEQPPGYLRVAQALGNHFQD